MTDMIYDRLIDRMLYAYIEWREQCAAVRASYRCWSTAPRSDREEAHRHYLAALESEQRTAEIYAAQVRNLSERVAVRESGALARGVERR